MSGRTYSRMSALALSLFALVACGSEGEEGRKERDAGANGSETPGNGSSSVGEDGATPGGAEAGPGKSDGGQRDAAATPVVEPPCAQGQSRCRGACFDQVGQKKNGCELMFRHKSYLQLASDVSVPGAIFATSPTSAGLLRIETSDFSVKVLDDVNDADTIYGLDGSWLYYGKNYDVRRVPLAGGASETVLTLTGYEVDQALVFGDHLYFTSNRNGLWRIPLAGGAKEQVITLGFDFVALDADFIYTQDWLQGVQRRTWQAPNEYELIIPSSEGAVMRLFLFAAQPKQLFAEALKSNKDLLLSVPTAGGAVKTVHDLGYASNSIMLSTGTNLSYTFQGRGADNANQRGLDLLSPDGKKRTIVDSDDRGGTLTEDATYLYLARENSVFRIAKSAL